MPANQKNFTLHKATSDDASAISALTDAAYSHYIQLIGRKPLPMTADYAKMAFENEIWLLHVEQQLAGVLVLEHEPDTLLIYSIAIQPEFQKQGFGQRLLAFAEQQAIQAGYRSIRLYTNEKFTYNINLYKSLGYQETGREALLNSTIVHMVKRLG